MMTSALVKESQQQVVLNDFYYQNNNKILTHNEIINSNLKSIVNSKYTSCVLNGFDILITEMSSQILKFKITKGMVILNYLLFELLDDVEIEYIPNKNFEYLVISLSRNDKYLQVDINKNELEINNDLPIKIFRLKFNGNNLKFFSFDVTNIHISYQYPEMDYAEFERNNKLSSIDSVNKYFSKPRKFKLNDVDFLIPNYGRHYEMSFKLMQIMNQNLFMDRIFGFPFYN